MRALEAKLEDVIDRDQIYRVPPFQRSYQWTPNNWFAVWKDLGDQYLAQPSEPPHFFGFVLREGLVPIQSHDLSTWQLIDGQQRMTTAIILRSAIHDGLRETARERFQGKHPAHIWRANASGELTNSGSRLVQPTSKRESEFSMMVEGEWREWYQKLRSKAGLRQAPFLWAYSFFRYLIWLGEESFELEQPPSFPWYKKVDETSDLTVEQVWESRQQGTSSRIPFDLNRLDEMLLKRFELIAINIETRDENPSVIYEGLNSKGENLQQWDFVRNLIFLQLPSTSSVEFFERLWNPINAKIDEIVYDGMRGKPTEAFLYDYLICRRAPTSAGSKSISRKRLYNHLQLLIQHEFEKSEEDNFAKFLEEFIENDLLAHASTWCEIMTETYASTALQNLPTSIQDAIESIGKFSKGPTAPLVLRFVHGFKQGEIEERTLGDALKLLESAVARLVLCQENLSPLRARVMSLSADLKSPSVDTLRTSLNSGNFIPDDSMVMSKMKGVDYYGSSSSVTGGQLGAIFRGIERELAGEIPHPLPYGAGMGDFSVEHVLPQSCFVGESPKFNKSWKAEYSALLDRSEIESAMAAAQAVGNRIGNLTLITNKCQGKVGAKNFEQKSKVLEGGCATCPMSSLNVSSSITQYSKQFGGSGLWSAKEIIDRSSWLASKAIERWPLP